MTSDDVEDWVYHQLEDTTHLLHGVVHGNGFGHLLRVNGREGGSRFLSGNHIMDFWDRLCSALGVRLGFLIVNMASFSDFSEMYFELWFIVFSFNIIIFPFFCYAGNQFFSLYVRKAQMDFFSFNILIARFSKISMNILGVQIFNVPVCMVMVLSSSYLGEKVNFIVK